MLLKVLMKAADRIRAVRESGDQGATAVEYGLLVGLIAVVIIGTVTTLGDNMSDMFDGVAGEIAAP